MNKVYRVIWNESLGAWVAVSELSKSKTKSSKTRTIGSVIAAGLMLTFSAGAIAAGAPMTTCTPLDLASIFNSNSLFGQNIVCAWNTTNSTLVGNNITAAGNGVNLVAVGNNISTGGESSTVLGSKIIHSGRFTTVIGQNINSRTEHSIVMGEDTTIDGGNYDISIGGNQNILNSQHTVALGNNIKTSGSSSSLAAGNYTTITNSRLATAVGDRASVTDSTASSAFGAGSSIIKADHSTAVGEGASVNKSNSSFAGGENASITGGYGNIAIGFTSTVSDTFGSTAIGYQSSVTGNVTGNYSRGMALGTHAKVTDSDRGTALGASASVTNSASASASGNNASVTDSSYAQADGAGAKVTSSKSATAVGNDAIVTNSGSATAVGNGANITDSASSVAVGQLASVTNSNVSTASGYKAKITDSYQAQAYGTGNSIANSNQASAFGVNSSITSSASGVAIGNNAKLNSAADGIAIGSSANVTSVANGIAIGKNAAVTTANSVALGANSTTSNAVATEKATVGSITYGGFEGKSPVGVVSVGSQGKERQITNVAAGQITANSTDAINGSQLFSTQKALGNLASSTSSALGGGSKVQPDGSLSLPTYVITNNPKSPGSTVTVNNVGDALTALDQAVNTGLVFNGNTGNNITKKLGDTLSIKGGLANADAATATNLRVDEENGELKIKLARNLKDLDSVTVGGPTGPSITTNGINAGDKKITNVADGDVSTTSKDAINGSQLNTVKETAEKGWKFTATNGTTISAADTVKPGETLDFANTDGNIGITSGDNKLTFNLAKNIKVDSVTAGDTVVKNDGITIVGGPSVTTTGINAGNKVITGVAAGALSTTSTEAVNGSQLNATNLNVTKNAGDITKNTGDITNLTNGTLGIVKQAVTPNGVITVGNATGGTVVDFTNGSNVSRTLTGVADGAINATSKEAINGSQLNTTNTNVTAAQTTANAAQTTANLGFNIKGGTSTADNVQLGQTVNFTSSNGNLIATNTDNTVNFQLNPILTGLTSVQAGNSLLDTNGLTIAGGPRFTVNGIDADGQQITGVASGGAITDAANANNAANIGDVSAAVTGVTNAGLNFAGDNGAAVNRKLGDTINITGGATTPLASAGNIGISNDANNGLLVQLAEDIDLGTDGSVKTGASLLDNTGLTITGGPSVTTAGINAGNKVITGVADGLVAAGSKDAINGGQLNTAVTSITNTGFNIAADNGTTDNVKLGDTVTYASSDKSVITTITDNNVNFALGDTLSVGGPGVNGAPGTDGFIGINGKDGVSGVAINGINGSIGLTGPSGVNGTISVKNGAPGLDGTTGPRLDLDGKEIATLQDGLKFAGNTGTTIAKTLNETLSIEGGLADAATASDANLRVDSDGNKLSLVMARNLTDLDSVTVGNSLLNNDGLTIANGPRFTVNGIDADGQQITGVASGGAITDAANANNAANIGDVSAAVTGVTNAGLNFAGDNGAAVNRKLGDTINITGGATTPLASAGNIGISNDANNGLLVQLAEDIDLGTDGSVKTGASLLDNTGLTITGGPSVTTAGINAGNKVITGVADGLVAAGSKDAINGGQLNTAVTSITNTGFNIAADNGTTDNVKLGDTVTYASSDKSVITTITDNNVNFALGDTLSVGGPGVNGAPGTDGFIGINGKDGVSGVAINGINGSIGLTGPSGVNGTISVKNGAPGLDGTTGPRLDLDGKEIATLQDGLKFAGNTGTTIAKTLNETLSIEGGLADAATASDANLRVDSDGNKLSLVMARNLTDLDSVTVGNSLLNNDGLTIANGPRFTVNGIDADGQQITGVASGGAITDAANANNAANIGDVSAAVTGVTNAGLNFAGDNGAAVNRKLGDTINITGGATTPLASAGNIGISNDANNGLLVQLAEDIDLGTDGSVKTGASLLDNTGLTITGGPSVTTAGINAGNKVITGVADGLVAAGSKDAINGGQLNTAVTSITNTGFNIAADNGTTDNVKLGDTVTYASSDKSVITTITDNNVNFALGDTLSVGGPGVNGAPGTDGFIGINGKDGVSGVAINGINGSIGLTGPSGVNGTISVKNGAPGLDGTTGPRLDLDGKEIATLQDGLKFAGNTGTTIAKTLNETLSIEGGLADAATASDANLRVDSDGNKLSLVMARNLTDLDSVTVGNSLLNNDGLTIANGPRFTVNGIDADGQQITGVASGGAITDAANANNAANIGDVSAAVTGVTNAGLNFAGDNGAAVNRKLGDTINITGGATTPLASAGNIGISNDANNGLLVQLAEDIDLGTDGSVKTGASLLDNTGLTITGGPSVTTAGINAGNKVITGVADGLVAAGSKDAINGGQLNTAVTSITNTGFNIAADNGTTDNVKLGDTVTYASSDKSVITTITDNNVNFALGDTLSVGGPGVNGAPGTDGFIGINGKDGVSGVAINGINGSIGLTGPSGVNGTISVKNGAPGLDGTTGPRLDLDGKEIATLQDGLKFAGNTGTTIAKTLNETLSIEGGLADAATASDANLRVDSDGNKLSLVMARNLTDLDSVTVGNSLLNNDGLTIANGPRFTVNGIDADGQQITGVASGGAITDAANANNAANIGDVSAAVTGVTNAGLNFAGDNGAAVNRKLGDTINITGGATTPLASAGNIGISNDANNGLLVQLAEDIDLGTDGSVKTGASLLDNTGLTITGGPSVTTAGINAGNKVITGVADGLVAAGSKDAINGGQLNTAVTSITNTGFNIAADNGTTDNVKLGDTVTYASSDKSVITTITDNNVNFALGDTLSVGGPGVNGAPGTDGFIGINGKDGVSGVAINGINGSIGLTGPSGVNGTISVKNGAPGLDGTTGPRLDLDGKEIATLQDGLKFAGNTGTTIAKTLNETLSIEGGLADAATASDANLRVDSDGNKLSLVMARNLTDLDSVTVGNSLLNNDGLTIANGPRFTVNGIDADGQQITGVASGGAITDAANANNAANIGDVSAAVTGVTNAGLNFAGDNGAAVNRKLGDTINITGGATTPLASAGNIGISNDANNGLLVQLAEDIDLGTDGSVKTGASLLDNTGLTITGGPSVTKTGINAGGNKITNVAAGTATTDGVNVSQLKPVVDALGGGSVVNPDGTVKAPSYTVNNAAVNNVGDAIKALDKGWTVNADAKLGAGQAVKAGDSVDIGVADDEKNITVAAKTADGKTVIDFALAKDLKVDSVNAGGTVINNNGLSFVDANGVALAKTPSIKKDGIDAGGNKITNVADGGVSTTSKDAINGSQLNTVKETAEKGWNFTATNGTTISAADTVKPGETLDFANTDGNIGITSADNKLTFNLAKDIKVDSVTAGDTVVNNNGITIVGGPSVTKTGIDAAGKKITNVAPGTISKDSKDAINGSQIYNLGNNVTNLFGGNASYDGDHITWNNIGGTGKNNIDDAIKSIGDQAATANKGWNLATDQGTASNVKPNDLVNINGDKASGIVVSNTGNNVTIGLSDKVKVGDKVSIDGTTGEINAGQIKIDGNKGTINNLNNTTWNGPNNIVSGQAATEDQLAQVVNNVNNQTTAAKTEVTQGDNIVVTASKAADGHSIYNVSTAKDVKFDSVTSNVVQVGNVKIDKDGINAGGQKVTNVAAGKVSTTSTDAVNGSQLYGYAEGVKNIIGGTTTYNPETGKYTNSDIGGTGKDNINDAIGAVNNSVINLGDRIDNAFYQTYKRIDKVEKEANAGIASAMAMETAPFIAGKWTYAVGAAYHGGEQAVGATLRKTADNGRWSLTGGVATGTEGDPSVRIGISGVID